VNVIKIDAVAIRAGLANMAPETRANLPYRARSIIVNVDMVHESVARLIRELRPVGLDELGLTAAIEHCANVWRTRLQTAQLSLTVDEHIDDLDEARSLVLYPIVQEALTNCARRARASRVDIQIQWHDGGRGDARGALVGIEDDGIGADLDSLPTELGLIGMRERVTALGGAIALESRPRTGFRLAAQVPATTAEGAAA